MTTTEARPLVLIDAEELDQRIEAAVRRALADRDRAPERSEWLDAEGAAELLGVSRRTISNYISKRRLPCSRSGRLLRFRRADLESFLERDR